MSSRPKTFAEKFYLEEAGMFERFIRDLRLLFFLFMTLVMWVKTRKVRAEFKHCRDADKPFYVDRFAPPESKS